MLPHPDDVVAPLVPSVTASVGRRRSERRSSGRRKPMPALSFKLEQLLQETDAETMRREALTLQQLLPMKDEGSM